MTDRSVTHATFTLERTYSATPARVFAAWSDPKAKTMWFVPEEQFESTDHEMDFRIGGREHLSAVIPDGPTYTYDARYQDIVDDERIVTTYEMQVDGQRMSVSVATVEFKPVTGGTRLVMTEQGAFLDGLDNPKDREQGTLEFLGKLGDYLERQSAAAEAP